MAYGLSVIFLIISSQEGKKIKKKTKLPEEFQCLVKEYFAKDGKTEAEAEVYITSIAKVNRKGNTWIAKKKDGQFHVWSPNARSTRSLVDIWG